MILKNKIEEITLDKKGIILSYKEREQKEILYSELDSIYISVKKTKPFYEFVLISISAFAAAFSYFLLQTNIILTLSALLFFSFFVKWSTYKKYALKIRLLNGEIIETKIPAESKHLTIDIVNAVRKEIYHYKIQRSNEALLPILYEAPKKIAGLSKLVYKLS